MCRGYICARARVVSDQCVNRGMGWEEEAESKKRSSSRGRVALDMVAPVEDSTCRHGKRCVSG